MVCYKCGRELGPGSRWIKEKENYSTVNCSSCLNLLDKPAASTENAGAVYPALGDPIEKENFDKFACPGCERFYTNLWSLKGHIYGTHNGTYLKCWIAHCQTYFETIEQRKSHISSSVEEKHSAFHGRKHCCEDCDYKSDQQCNLNSHIKSHHKICSICGYKSQSKTAFDFHKDLHKSDQQSS